MPDPTSAKRRLPADKRREVMLDAAAVFFAEHGFDASTRDIARALDVTQALIYKHFSSKEDLIERTLEQAFQRSDRPGPWIRDDRPLREELVSYYCDFAANSSDRKMRLFIRAGLDGRSLPARRGHALTRTLFVPVIKALRQMAGLPSLDDVPAMRGERELCMMLHASVVFLGIRRHIYGMDMPDNVGDVVELYVSTFIAGAPSALQRIHEGSEASFSVQLATPSR